MELNRHGEIDDYRMPGDIGWVVGLTLGWYQYGVTGMNPYGFTGRRVCLYADRMAIKLV